MKGRTLTVVLRSCGSRDFGEDPCFPLPGVRPRRVRVATLRAAREACLTYIAQHDLGGGHWIGGQVFDGRRQIARVSYSGRVWRSDGSPGFGDAEITNLD